MEKSEEEYAFDPSSIIKIISENPQIGLALIQLPINIANSLIRKCNEYRWSEYPSRAGYYWVNMNGIISIKEYSSNDINSIVRLGNSKNYQYFGPLEPPNSNMTYLS
jgi:hypothetical protein